MRKGFRDFVKNMSYSFSSNILTMLISLIAALVIPKLISVDQYGYYQLYIFYANYVGVSFLGLCDGFYLRLGGKYYDDINKPVYCTQFWLLGLYEIVFFFCIFAGSRFLVTDADKQYVIGCTCIAALAMCLTWFTTYILQATAQIKEYAIVTVLERVLYVLAAVPLILAGYRGFRMLILVDVAAKYIAMLSGVYYCRNIVFAGSFKLREGLAEAKKNIAVGFQYMLALLCNMLIIGVVRFGIEHHWDITIFSKVSVTITVSNLILTAINAVAVVIYPMLRRTNEERLPQFYRIIRVLLGIAAFFVLVFYYPVQRILSVWLPQYAESLRYAAILFPICVYESKMSMLVNTYYKTLRLERLLMKCNMAALALSVVLTLVSTLVLNSVTAAIISILIVLIIRCILSEMILSTKFPIKVVKDIIIELVMTLAFIICNWYFGLLGMFMYAVCYVIYLIIKRKDILESLNFIKSMR